jgi:hypothetical protein
MKCNEIKELLSAYADGELSDELKNSVDKHAAECAACKELLAEQVKLHEQIAVISKTPALPDMESRIMSAVTNTGAQKKTRPWLRPVLVAGPVVLALAILLPIVIPSAALTPEKVLAKAGAAANEIKSYRMTGEYYIYDPVTKEYALRAFGGITFSGDRYSEQQEFIIPSNYYRDVTGAGTYEAIGIGEKAYGRVTGSLGYAPGMAASEWQQYMPSEILTRKTLSMLVKIEELPDENIDGMLCYHYRGSVDMVKFVNEYPQQAGAFRTSTINEEFWIGKDDYIIRQFKDEIIRGEDIMARLPMLTAQTLEVWKYSDFNVSITIEPPLDAQGNLLSGWVVIPVQ